jgi:enoyl-CoA hydratase
METPSPAVSVERDGPVTTVVLHRPERRNAVDGPTAQALADAFRAFEADPDAAVAVLYGEGGTFCSGADLTAIGTPRGNRVEDGGDGPMGPTRMRLTKPVVAAVEGYAVAGGLELALWCDLRVVAADATLGVFCRRWGVPLIDGGTVRLPRIVGEGVAADLVLTGRPVDAEEALRIGLATRVVPAGEARAAAESLAHELSRLPQTTMRHDLASVKEQHGLTEQEALANELVHGRASLDPDAPDGAVAGARRFAQGAGRHGSPS